MSEDEKNKITVRELVEYRGFQGLVAASAFLQKIGRKIDEVESVVTNVNTGVTILMETGRYVIDRLSQPDVDGVIDYHRRQIERLEKERRKNL